ncbi:unnamed protein product [Rhizoctonia solani]|uniref:Uncharacterized protein n=1 Tax=Rhizoctonia solani TaxID=456999 RepID=A0A8H3GPA9_9AGAM|nr:unnamed protein product [Rhizoctonia solani]
MYTPTRRRDSVSEPVHKFTPSKRGQAALDALALGYDVQLPEYSFALLPRTSVSEQTLNSFVSTGNQKAEQLPRSTSFVDSHRRTDSSPKQHRNRGPDISDEKQLVRQARSPVSEGRRSTTTEDWALDFSTSQSSTATTTADSSSRASSSSYQPSNSQYVLDSPRHARRSDDPTYRERPGMGVPSSHTPRSMADITYQSSPVRHHSVIIHQTPSSQLASRPQSQNETNKLIPAASSASNNEELGRFPGNRLATRSHPSRPSPLQLMTQLPVASSVERSLEAYFSPRSEEYQINIQQLGGSAQYARIHSGISGTRPSHGQPYGARPQALKSPAWSTSGARHSPVDRVTRQLPEGEVFYGDSGPPRPHHHHSSSEPPVPVTSARRNSRPQAGSQRPQLTPSLMVSSLPSYATSPTSGQYASNKPRLRVSTQSIPGSSTQPLRSAPLPSTSSSSRATPSFHDDDEAFKVHPERAAVSRMETLLMLGACRAEARGSLSSGIPSYPATDGVIIASPGHNHPGSSGPGPQISGRIYQTLAQPNLLGLSDTKAQGPPEAPRDMGFREGTVVPAQERPPANRRPRQRSGSMGPSSLSDSPHRPRGYNMPFRNRQRSASAIVQGLSPDAVKKLRMYEQLKYQDKGRPESLRAIVGCTAKYRVYGARARKHTAPSQSKTPVSPTQVLLPPSPVLSPVVPQKEASFVPPVAKLPDPPSPRNVPLPLSPLQSPTLCTTANLSSPTVSSLLTSDSFMRYCSSRGIESPRPIRTRQNTISGRVIPTLRLISSPERIDPQSETGASQVDPAGETQEALGGGAIPMDERASLKTGGLKLEPQLERILTPTPPPAFWSPPPHSAVIRTSAPLPLLPGLNLPTSSPTTRAASISLPATRAASALPLRPMSVPPPGDSVRVGDSDDVRRAWSCQPATAELPPVKSFAGDWTQSMVIELSDEEEEEEEEGETTDTDFSELEDEDVDDCQVLDASEVVADGDLITLPEPKSNPIGDARIGAASQDKQAESRVTSKGVVSSGVGSGVNAVEAVQNAIVKLALDNAEAALSRRPLQMRPNRPAAPVRTVSRMTARPTANQPPLRHSLDSERPRDLNQPHTPPNRYLAATSRAYRTPTLPLYPHLPTNLALESLRSGLELRAAASASAVEEAVRARSASPNIPPQDVHALSSRPNPGFVLPPRLQRLQGINPRTTPLPTPRLEIPAPPSPRLDIHQFQQRRSPYESPLHSASPASTLYPGAFNVPQYPTLARQYPGAPLVQERNHVALNVSTPNLEQAAPVPKYSTVSEASTSSNRGQLTNIVVDNKPVPPAPATAPLSRNHGERKRQTRRSAEAVMSNSQDSKAVPVIPAPAPPAPAPVSSVETPTQSTTSSPKPKQKRGKKYWPKHRKNPASEQAKAAAPAPSTPVVPPKSTEPTPTPKKSSVSPPKKRPTPTPKKDPAPVPTPKDSLSSTPKPKRKYKPPKKQKSTKPGAAPASSPAPAPAVTS